MPQDRRSMTDLFELVIRLNEFRDSVDWERQDDADTGGCESCTRSGWQAIVRDQLPIAQPFPAHNPRNRTQLLNSIEFADVMTSGNRTHPTALELKYVERALLGTLEYGRQRPDAVGKNVASDVLAERVRDGGVVEGKRVRRCWHLGVNYNSWPWPA